jgi:ABC-type glutathione transport system ATPase component
MIFMPRGLCRPRARGVLALAQGRAVSLLRAEGLSKEFGGLLAVDKLSFEIAAGAVHSIIGPNGAGKTTLLNLLTGIYAPSGGRIWLEESELTGRAPYEFAAAGVARTFQNLQIFFNMSALENVMVGRYRQERCSLGAALLRTRALARAEACREEAAELMRFVGLAARTRADAMPQWAPPGDRAPWRRSAALWMSPLRGSIPPRPRRSSRSSASSPGVATRWCWSSTTCAW